MNGNAANCPNEDSLYMFVVGALDDLASERIREHAESCKECGHRLLEAIQLQNTANTLAKFPRQQRDDEKVERWMETVSKKLTELDSVQE